MNFDETLALLDRTVPDDIKGLAEVRMAWSELLRKDLNRLDDFFAYYFEAIEASLARPAKRGLMDRLFKRETAPTDMQTYKFVNTFVSMDVLAKAHGGVQAAHQRLAERQTEHLSLIERALARDDIEIAPNHLNGSTGRWGDVVASMIETYYWFLSSGPQMERLKREAAPLAAELYRRFPHICTGIPLEVLEMHPSAIDEFAKLMRLYIVERGAPGGGPMENISDNMLGPHSRRDEFVQKNGVNIMARLLADAETWSAANWTGLIDGFVLEGLDARPQSRDGALAQTNDAIERLEARLKRPPAPVAGISQEQMRTWDEKFLADNRRVLEQIETDFAGWITARLQAAAKLLAVSPTKRRIVEAVVARAPAAHAVTLLQLLDMAAQSASKPKRFPIPDPSQNRFRDLGFKYLAIKELMYVQGALKPKFAVRTFAKEYEAEEISVENDGYDIIPAVEAYFRNLPIADDLLGKVEKLHLSSGLDGGAGFMKELWPFWDPGCGDEPIAVGAEAIHDLALLPNLKSISGLENSKPGPELLAALEARGVELIDEHTVAFGKPNPYRTDP